MGNTRLRLLAIALLLVVVALVVWLFAGSGKDSYRTTEGEETSAACQADPSSEACREGEEGADGAEARAALLARLTTSGSLPFSGAVTDAGCDSDDFPDVAADSTLNVTMTSDVVTNDLMILLIYGGQTVHKEDTGVGQETFTYTVPASGGGTYTVRVCKSDGTVVTPFLLPGGPYTYTGTFNEVDASVTPPTSPPGNEPPASNGVTPTPVYSTWNAGFAAATVADPQRTEGEPLVFRAPNGALWESGPWGFTTTQSFVHYSSPAQDGREFRIVSPAAARPDAPPGGGDTDIAVDDQGYVYFVDLEGALNEFGTSVSNDGGQNWRKNATAVQQSAVDRQWYAVDNGSSSGAADNTIFLAFHQTAAGTFIYSSPGSTGATDPVGGLVWQKSSGLPGSLNPIAGDAICAQLRFDPVKRNLYYACNEDNHIRISVGHVAVGQRTGIQYTNYVAPNTPGGGAVLNLFPALATDAAGNVYVAWIDAANFNLYYSFSSDEGHSWSAPTRVNSGPAVTNEFDWAQAGTTGQLALAWYATARTDPAGSDGMPSAIDNLGAATAYPWYGYAALISGANTAAPNIAQARFTAKPMHYGNICNSGLGCTTDPSADRTMADFFGFTLGAQGALRISFNDTTNEFDGAGLFFARQLSGKTPTGANLKGTTAVNPVSDPTGDAHYPNFAPTGAGPNYPQLDLTALTLSQPAAGTLRVRMSVANLALLTPPTGKATSVWLTRFQALAPQPNGPEQVYRIFYVEMEATAGTPTFKAGTATCQGTTPSNCKIFQYRGEQTVTGSISGNAITIDVPLATGFGVPIQGTTLYNVTAFTFGRSNSFDDLYGDVDASEPFDYTSTCKTGGWGCGTGAPGGGAGNGAGKGK